MIDMFMSYFTCNAENTPQMSSVSSQSFPVLYFTWTHLSPGDVTEIRFQVQASVPHCSWFILESQHPWSSVMRRLVSCSRPSWLCGEHGEKWRCFCLSSHCESCTFFPGGRLHSQLSCFIRDNSRTEREKTAGGAAWKRNGRDYIHAYELPL